MLRVDDTPVLVDVRGPSPSEAVVLNNGPATVYYGASRELADAHTSSLAKDATVTLTSAAWFVVASPNEGYPVVPANLSVAQSEPVASPGTAQSGSGAGSVDTDEPTQGSTGWLLAKVDSQGAFTRQLAIYSPAPPPPDPVAPANTVAPAISGTAETGQTLTCSNGTWTGTPTPTYARQWKRNGSAITGETSSTYLLDVADEGTSVKCTVTATNTQGSASADSNTVTPTAPTGPSDPATTFGAKLVHDYDAASLGANGSAVSAVTDAAGSDDWAQATSGLRPLVATETGGFKVMDFDGSDDTIGVVFGASIPQPYTVLAVFKGDAVVADTVVAQLWDGGGSSSVSVKGQNDATDNIDFNTGSHVILSHAATAHDDYHAWAFVADGSSTAINVDGTDVATGTGGATGLSQLFFGDFSGGGGFPYAFRLARALVLNDAPTAGEIADWVTYCQDTYSTP